MKGDIQIVGGAAATPTLPFRVDDRTTSSASATHKPGEPLKQSNANFALLCATGEPVQSAGLFIGIAHNESDETSTADGSVDVDVCVPFVTRLRAKATTAANLNTDALLEGLLMDAVTFDLTAGVFTVDEDEGDDPNEHGLVIVDGDINKGTIDFVVKPLVSVFGHSI